MHMYAGLLLAHKLLLFLLKMLGTVRESVFSQGKLLCTLPGPHQLVPVKGELTADWLLSSYGEGQCPWLNPEMRTMAGAAFWIKGCGGGQLLPASVCPFFLVDSRSLFFPLTIANKDVKDGGLEGRPWKREVNRVLSKIQTLSP